MARFWYVINDHFINSGTQKSHPTQDWKQVSRSTQGFHDARRHENYEFFSIDSHTIALNWSIHACFSIIIVVWPMISRLCLANEKLFFTEVFPLTIGLKMHMLRTNFYVVRGHSITTWTRKERGGGSFECPRGPKAFILRSIFHTFVHCNGL